ncbi:MULTISPECIES: SH3 domain-containing protein [unclassified Streptomyces]|uniref:SH3 domain-containing protein n=1 Tax=unclassified Streptomyces TaxID=2593676 RepID=UPI003827FFB3
MSTTDILVARGKQFAAGAGALTTAAVLGATLLAATPAQAAAPAKPYGTVTVTALNERQYPSTDSAVKGTLRYHEQIGLVCKVHAQNIAGNSIWYLVRDRSATWVSAKYVANTGYVKYCKDVQRGRVQPNSTAKNAMG